MTKYAERLAALFNANAKPDQASKMESYMKDKFPFFGIKTPERRNLQSSFFGENGLPEYSNLKKVVFELFDRPEREFHYSAIEICGKVKKSWQKDTIHLFEKMAKTKSWWDSVDSINIVCIKPHLKLFPDDIDTITQDWIDSHNIWLQRLSLICQLRLKQKTDKDLLVRNILQLANSGEFFIQKAIGWALRDLAHSDPKWVKGFVEGNELKPLSRREALKNLK